MGKLLKTKVPLDGTSKTERTTELSSDVPPNTVGFVVVAVENFDGISLPSRQPTIVTGAGDEVVAESGVRFVGADPFGRLEIIAPPTVNIGRRSTIWLQTIKDGEIISRQEDLPPRSAWDYERSTTIDANSAGVFAFGPSSSLQSSFEPTIRVQSVGIESSSAYDVEVIQLGTTSVISQLHQGATSVSASEDYDAEDFQSDTGGALPLVLTNQHSLSIRIRNTSGSSDTFTLSVIAYLDT
jgi:hypothetical protein